MTVLCQVCAGLGEQEAPCDRIVALEVIGAAQARLEVAVRGAEVARPFLLPAVIAISVAAFTGAGRLPTVLLGEARVTGQNVRRLRGEAHDPEQRLYTRFKGVKGIGTSMSQ